MEDDTLQIMILQIGPQALEIPWHIVENNIPVTEEGLPIQLLWITAKVGTAELVGAVLYGAGRLEGRREPFVSRINLGNGHPAGEMPGDRIGLGLPLDSESWGRPLCLRCWS